tara:strand:+ start:563 stop:1000 length:438 start_codon:yes stop_codon:yes gene_type:complete
MNCDTSALQIILILFILNLVVLYFYQSGWITLPEKKKDNITNAFPNNKAGNDEKFTVGNQTMMPSHQNEKRIKAGARGVKKGFHQHFKPNMPELGWRDYYIKHNNTLDGVCQLNKECNPNFKNIITRSYLDKLENVNNVYQNVNY